MISRENSVRSVAFLINLTERVTDICIRDQMFVDQDMSIFTDIAEIIEEILAQGDAATNEPKINRNQALSEGVAAPEMIATIPGAKPGEARRNLVKATALLLAEIERIDRGAEEGAAF
ncbi:hypothetical protein [Caballeronia sp. KNU42]